MRRIALYLLVVMAAAAAETPQELYQKALLKERSEGNLNEAIQLYRRATDTAGKDRALAAKALVQLGECYEKLGSTEAQKQYERVIRDYADQKDAVAMARTRLGGSAETTGIVARQAWTGPKVDTLGAVSPDGRSLSFVDWETGDLAVHDLVTGNDRRLTNKGTWEDNDEFAEESVISRDGKQVAYAWFNKDFRYELRLGNLSGDPNPRRLFYNEDVEWMAPFDWTPDGKWIAVQITRKDKTSQIGLVSTVDGSLRVLKSVDWRGATRLSFTPDGKYLAYDLPQSELVEQRDIFLLAIDGSREISAVVHPANDTLMGWAPDGKHLLFGSDRTGAVGIWALPISDGKLQGAPELIKPDIGQVSSMGLGRSGALYYGFSSGGRDIYAATIDFTSGEVLSPPAKPIQSFIGSNTFPDWSPNGKYFSYISQREQGGRAQLLALRSPVTGETRELRVSGLKIYGRRYWTPDASFIAVTASDRKGKQGVYRIDVETGEVSPLVLSEPGVYSQPIGWSSDGGKLYYVSNDRTTGVVIERELASGKEREMLRRAVDSGRLAALSSDGRQLAFIESDRSQRSSMLSVIPVEGGQPRELVRAQFPESVGSFNSLEWTPDGNSVIFRKDNGERHELWQVSLTDGKSRRLPIDLPVRQVRLHPDGRQITFLSGDQTREVWVMENFLPKVSAKK